MSFHVRVRTRQGESPAPLRPVHAAVKDDATIILECPSCLTRYEVPGPLPESGRKVRCAKCAHIWMVKPGDEVRPSDFVPWHEETVGEEVVFREGQAAQASDTAELAVEEDLIGEAEARQAEPDAEPQALQADAGGPEDVAAAPTEPVEPGDADLPENEASEAETDAIVIGKRRRRPNPVGGIALGWVALALAVICIGYAALAQRVTVVRLLPGSAWVYDRLGLPVNVRGLDFQRVAYSWETDAGRVVLEVHGDIVNRTGESLRVPTVVFALRDDRQAEIYQWTEDVLTAPLAAGEKATFVTRIPTPPKSVASVQVRFAK